MNDLLFLPANGFPSECYQPLLTTIKKDTSVQGFDFWVSFSDQRVQSWFEFLPSIHDHLLGYSTPPIIGGHSIGATLALAIAIRYPTLISGLFLLDPALFLARHYLPMKLARHLNVIQYVHPFMKVTHHKRTRFDSHDQMFQRYRTKEAFKGMSDDHLNIFVHGLLKEEGHEFVLRFPKQLELSIYSTTGSIDPFIWSHLHDIKVPSLLIRAAHSNTFFVPTQRRFFRLPNFVNHTVSNTSHLLPFESPVEIAYFFQSFFKDIGGLN